MKLNAWQCPYKAKARPYLLVLEGFTSDLEFSKVIERQNIKWEIK